MCCRGSTSDSANCGTPIRCDGISVGQWPTERVKQVRDESHTVRRELPPITPDELYTKDELYRVWLRFFIDVLPDEYC